MQGSLRCPYPLASHGRLHADEEDRSLGFEWQADISRYKPLPHDHMIQRFLVYYHTSNMFSAALCLLLNSSYCCVFRTLKV
jgi:hypothetical protein